MILQRAPKRDGGPRRFLAFGATLATHAGIVYALLVLMHPSARPKPEQVVYLTPEPLRPPPETPKPKVEPPPVPAPAPHIAEAPKPVEKPRKPAPPPAAHPPPADAGPPVHYYGGPGAVTGTVTSGLGSAGDGIARHAPSDYADKVKARILANKVFPMEAQLKGQECVVTYSVTVDRMGHMIAHHIDPCPYPLVNQAAEATILKSGPYDPPDNGAETRVVYGSLPFHLEIQLPPVRARR